MKLMVVTELGVVPQIRNLQGDHDIVDGINRMIGKSLRWVVIGLKDGIKREWVAPATFR